LEFRDRTAARAEAGPKPGVGRAAWVGYAPSMSTPEPTPVDSSAATASPAASPEPVDTPALRALAASGLAFTVVRTVKARNPEESAALQGIPLGSLLRTIVVRRGADDYVFVLVPAGRRFDWPKLRSHLGVSRLSLPDQDEAKAVTGYERGAITPFGASRAWPVIADATIVTLDRVAIGGGARGVNVHLAPGDLVSGLAAEVADVTAPDVTVPEEPGT